MCNIRTHTIVFELSLSKKKKMNKIKIFAHGYSNLKNVSKSCTNGLAMDQPRDVVYKHFAFVCHVFHGATPIPYVQVAILNLPHY